jgi:hypothetical protein
LILWWEEEFGQNKIRLILIFPRKPKEFFLEEWTISNFYQFYLMASGRPKWKILCDVKTKLIPCDITTTNFPFWTPKTYRNPPLSGR